jgi:hypothetical protein
MAKEVPKQISGNIKKRVYKEKQRVDGFKVRSNQSSWGT